MSRDFIEGAYGCLVMVSLKLGKSELDKALKQTAMAIGLLQMANENRFTTEVMELQALIRENKREEATKLCSDLLRKIGDEYKIEMEERQAADTLIRCPKCGQENLKQANFCKNCGNHFQKKECPRCKAKNSADSVFCIYCGSRF